MKIDSRTNVFLRIVFLACLLSVGVISGGYSYAVQGQEQSENPITLTGLVKALMILDGQHSEKLIESIRQRGVSFEMTVEIEKQLREAGSSADVIQAARDSFRGSRSDTDIRIDVMHTLTTFAGLKGESIVATVNHGEVKLVGTVSSGAAKELAGAIAIRIQGVTKVHNDLSIAPSSSSAVQVGNEYSQIAPNGDQRTDDQITSDVRQILVGMEAMWHQQISVNTLRHEVTLSGTVPDEYLRGQVGSLVARIKGVTAVRNNISIATSASPIVERRKSDSQIAANAGQDIDDKITLAVQRAISVSLYYPREKQIFVNTFQHEVTLSGSVPSENVKEMAESLAANVQGVTHVVNNLRVQQQNSAPNDFRSQARPTSRNTQQAEASSGLWRSSESGSIYRIEITDSYVTITPVSGTGHIYAHVPVKIDKSGKHKIMGQWQSDGYTGFISITEISDQQITATMIIPQSPGATCTSRTASFFENMNDIKQCKSVNVFWQRQ